MFFLSDSTEVLAMVRVETRYVLDVTMLISFIICAVTGFILWYAFPSGSGGGQWTVVLGVAKHDWIAIHDYSSLGLSVTIVIHFMINFNWMVQITKKVFRRGQS
jgi:cytochrome b subunit of formate dehydrogenase